MRSLRTQLHRREEVTEGGGGKNKKADHGRGLGKTREKRRQVRDSEKKRLRAGNNPPGRRPMLREMKTKEEEKRRISAPVASGRQGAIQTPPGERGQGRQTKKKMGKGHKTNGEVFEQGPKKHGGRENLRSIQRRKDQLVHPAITGASVERKKKRRKKRLEFAAQARASRGVIAGPKIMGKGWGAPARGETGRGKFIHRQKWEPQPSTKSRKDDQ